MDRHDVPPGWAAVDARVVTLFEGDPDRDDLVLQIADQRDALDAAAAGQRHQAALPVRTRAVGSEGAMGLVSALRIAQRIVDAGRSRLAAWASAICFGSTSTPVTSSPYT